MQGKVIAGFHSSILGPSNYSQFHKINLTIILCTIGIPGITNNATTSPGYTVDPVHCDWSTGRSGFVSLLLLCLCMLLCIMEVSKLRV